MSKISSTPHADFFSRLLAMLVDMYLWWLPLAAGVWYVSQQHTLVDVAVAAANVFLMILLPLSLVYLLYVVIMTSRVGGTIGKLALGLEVVNEEGNMLTWKRAFFREAIAKWVSGFVIGIGYLSVLWHPQKLAWHDTLSGTVVLQKANRYMEGVALVIGIFALNAWLGYQTFVGFTSNTQLIQDIQKMFGWSF